MRWISERRRFPDDGQVPGTRKDLPLGARHGVDCSCFVWYLRGDGAVALDKSQGFTKIIPVIVFFCGLAASMAGLSYAMRLISVGTAYLIWVGIGAAITVVYGMVVGEESVSVLKILCLIGMVACIAGLKLAG